MIQIGYYDGGNTDKRKAVEHILHSLPFSYQIFQQQDLGQRIGALMQIEGYSLDANASNQQATTELMLFQELSDEQIQSISQTLKDAQAHVACKAVVTIHNKDWILSDLLKEIAEEHAYFTLYDEAKQLILEFSSLQEDAYTMESWNDYQQAILQAYVLLQEQKVDVDVLDQLLHQMKQTKQALMQRNA